MSLLPWSRIACERTIAAALTLLLSITVATSAAFAKNPLDPANVDACRPDMEAGTKCRCEIAFLHPTQISVGMIQVEAKVQKLEKKKEEKKLDAYLEKKKNREPVIIGPEWQEGGRKGFLYITDHHHLARALSKMEVEYTYCQIEDNRRNQAVDDFWAGMVRDGNAWPEDEKGEKRAPTAIPSSVNGLRDDPYRSLAGEVRDACGFLKTSENFVEFKWADFFRKTNRLETGQPIVRELIQSDMDEAAEQAMELAKSPAAKTLPGYLAVPCKDQH